MSLEGLKMGKEEYFEQVDNLVLPPDFAKFMLENGFGLGDVRTLSSVGRTFLHILKTNGLTDLFEDVLVGVDSQLRKEIHFLLSDICGEENESLSGLNEVDFSERYILPNQRHILYVLKMMLRHLYRQYVLRLEGLQAVGVAEAHSQAHLSQSRDIQEQAERTVAEVREQLKKIRRLDSLTKLPDRGVFDEMRTEIKERHSETPCAVIYLDLDKFKSVNDSPGGHSEGDRVLVQIAEILKKGTPEDTAFRVGGDEFAIILRDMSVEEVLKLAENIRALVEAEVEGVTTSMGVAFGSGEEILFTGKEDRDLVKRADAAMYSAKQSEGNRVWVSGHEHSESWRSDDPGSK